MMTNLIRPLALVGLSLALVACASTSTNDEPPKDLTGTEIPITPAPEIEVADSIPKYFRNGSCVTIVMPGKRTISSELETFCNAFAEQFYGEHFKSMDPDVFEKAAARRRMFSGVPPGAALVKMADKEQSDFVVLIKLDVNVEPYSDSTRRDVSAKIIARGTATITSSAQKGGKQFKTTFKHVQATNNDKEEQMRDAHATVVGRLLAKKMINKVSGLTGLKDGTPKLYLIFKKFDKADKTEFISFLGDIKGIRKQDISERSVDTHKVDQFTIIVTTRMSATKLRAALMELAEEDYPNIEIKQPQKDTLMFIKGR